MAQNDTQTEHTDTGACCESYGLSDFISQVRQLLPPDEKLREFEQHIIRSQVELLKGVQIIVGDYLSRLEKCETEKEGRPERVSKIDITDEADETA